MIYYTVSHEWIQIKGRIGVVGITNYALEQLGAVVYIQLPKLDQTFKMGEEAAVLESTKAAADIYFPVAGKVLALNENLALSTAAINQAPEGAGWLFQIEVADPKELEYLLTKEAYEALIS